MKAKLIVEGKEFPIEIQDPELQKLLVSNKKTGYERAHGEDYFYFEYGGEAVRAKSCNDIDGNLYKSANYYSDEAVAENNARADNLMRQLRRFAVEHRKSELDWNDGARKKYYIHYVYRDNKFDIDYVLAYRNFGAIYFDTEEAAEAALTTFKDELTWYFTEYKDSL